jgi:hypothetical protein
MYSRVGPPPSELTSSGFAIPCDTNAELACQVMDPGQLPKPPAHNAGLCISMPLASQNIWSYYSASTCRNQT